MESESRPLETRRISIVGGGLAGLAAAWELVEAGRAEDVTVFERSDRLGGRVHSISHDGASIELGGFMVFSWYRELRTLLRATGLEAELVRYRTSRQYVEQPDGGYQGHARTPLRQLVPLRTLARLAPMYLTGKLDLYNPALDLHRNDSVDALYQRLVGPHHTAHRLLDTLFTGYTYAETSQLPAPVYLPLAPLIVLHGGFDEVWTLPGGMPRLVAALAERLVRAGVSIYTNTQVVACDTTTITVVRGEETSTLNAETVILASGITDPVLYQVLPEATRPQRDYTHHWSVVWQSSSAIRVNGDAGWGTIYNSPRSSTAPHIACYGHLSALQDHGDRHLVIGYLRIHPDDHGGHDAAVAARLATEQLHRELEVPADTVVIATHEWKPTMPITTVELLETLRRHDGRNGRWFAGDHLGAPSMEMATFTGRAAAKRACSKAV